MDYTDEESRIFQNFFADRTLLRRTPFHRLFRNRKKRQAAFHYGQGQIVGKPVRQNIVGPVVRKIRYQHGWTQAMLTARCSRVGWDVGENTIAKIEAQLRCVTDRELHYLARALKVQEQTLFPAHSKSTP